MPRYELLIVRDPDASTDVTLYVDGKPITVDAEVHVDPGAGGVLSEWRENAKSVAANETYSEALREAAGEKYEAYESSEFIEDDTDDEDEDNDVEDYASYDSSYLVHRNREFASYDDPRVSVTSLEAGDTYSDPATDTEDMWWEIEDVRVVGDDVYVLATELAADGNS